MCRPVFTSVCRQSCSHLSQSGALRCTRPDEIMGRLDRRCCGVLNHMTTTRDERLKHRRLFWIGADGLQADLGPNYELVRIKLWPVFANRPVLEFLTEHLMNEIRSIQPAGPYLIGGACLSGLFAYEVARRLVAANLEVRLLVMVDPSSPVFETRKRQISQRLLLSIHQPSTLVPVISGKLNALMGRFRRTRVSQPERLTNEQRWLDEFQKLRSRAAAKTFENYVMRPYEGRLTFIVAHRYKGRFLLRQAWCPFARAGVDIHVIRGEHHNILEVPGFAAKLRQCIDKVVAGDSFGDGRPGVERDQGAVTTSADVLKRCQPASPSGGSLVAAAQAGHS